MSKNVIIIILVVLLAAGGAILWGMADRGPSDDIGEAESEANEVFCTRDAKVCPDGSEVGRIPPDCEFAACPEPSKPVFEDGTLPE